MTTYEDLLVATREAETEWTENKSVHLKSTTLSDDKGLKDVQKEIVALTATLKSATFQGAKPKKAGTTGEKQAVKGKKPSQDKGKSQDKRTTNFICWTFYYHRKTYTVFQMWWLGSWVEKLS